MQKAGRIPPTARVGDILIASNLISQEQLEDAIAQHVITSYSIHYTKLYDRDITARMKAVKLIDS